VCGAVLRVENIDIELLPPHLFDRLAVCPSVGNLNLFVACCWVVNRDFECVAFNVNICEVQDAGEILGDAVNHFWLTANCLGNIKELIDRLMAYGNEAHEVRCRVAFGVDVLDIHSATRTKLNVNEWCPSGMGIALPLVLLPKFVVLCGTGLVEATDWRLFVLSMPIMLSVMLCLLLQEDCATFLKERHERIGAAASTFCRCAMICSAVSVLGTTDLIHLVGGLFQLVRTT